MVAGQKAPNLLIISDLHLGEDLRPAHRRRAPVHLVVLERELESFLAHYTHHRLEGRPWRLVVNGDMVDFLAVCLLPDGQGDPATVADPDERVYGLGSRPPAARAKMASVLARHPGVFRALARFLGAGNSMAIVAGNHDMEFHWPEVQETFRRGVSALWAEDPGAGRAGAPGRAEIEAAIAFHPWFYFEENVVWAEHGHQYDDYCSQEYVLDPVVPASDEIVLSVGAAGLRYVVNHSEAYAGTQQEDWSFWGHVSWTARHGARGVVRIARAYGAMVRRLLGLWRVLARRPGPGDPRRRTHRERIRALAERCRLGEETLVALHALRRRPVILNLMKLLAALFLDRLAVGVVATLLVLTSVLALPWSWALGAVGAVLGAAVVTNRVLARARTPIDPIAKLGEVPELIRQHIRAPFVVFGHSHDPVARRLRDGGWYFNTGTWVASERPGLLRAFTHLLIRKAADGPQALLCQWRDGRSVAFVP